MKKRTFIFVLFLVIILSSLCLVSCKENSEDSHGSTTKVEIKGAYESNKIIVYATNLETEEQIKITALRKENYECSQSISCGKYNVTKVESSNRECEVTPITTYFSIYAENADAAIIEIEEKNMSGTLTWFLKNNIVSLTIITGLCIALVIIKMRKRPMRIAKQQGNCDLGQLEE